MKASSAIKLVNKSKLESTIKKEKELQLKRELFWKKMAEMAELLPFRRNNIIKRIKESAKRGCVDVKFCTLLEEDVEWLKSLDYKVEAGKEYVGMGIFEKVIVVTWGGDGWSCY